MRSWTTPPLAGVLGLLLPALALADAGSPDPGRYNSTDVDWTVSSARAPEGHNDGSENRVLLTLKLDRPAPGDGVQIGFELEGRTATPHLDFWAFNPDVFYFEPGESEKVVAVGLRGDGEVECDEGLALRTWFVRKPETVRYGHVVVLNDDWEGPGPVWRDAGVVDAGSAEANVAPPPPTDPDARVYGPPQDGPRIHLACHDDPNYDPLVAPPPGPDGGVADSVDHPGSSEPWVNLPDASPARVDSGATVDGGAPPPSPASPPDARSADGAATSTGGGGCRYQADAGGAAGITPGLVVAVVALWLTRRRRRGA